MCSRCLEVGDWGVQQVLGGVLDDVESFVRCAAGVGRWRLGASVKGVGCDCWRG